jgi:acetylornithine deacetylase/succinyl-diaminopimelate desuccinylase-like protein
MGAPAELDPAFFDPLCDLLRIPSVSSGGTDPRELRRAAEWICDRVTAADGEAEIVETPGNPLALGLLSASSPNAPTVLVYGHYDVQGGEPLELWDSPPFEPDVREGKLYARGASDDKGNFMCLLHTACEMARAGELPLNVRILAEGEEETGSDNVGRWLAQDDGPADCALIYDSLMVDRETPAITIAARGVVQLTVEVVTGKRDLHSGLYGGTVHNAIHVLNRMLAAVLPNPDGTLREELRAGVIEPTPREVESWAELPPGATVIEEGGSLILHETSAQNYYRLTGSEPSFDLTGISGGVPDQLRTIIPARAQAKVAMRVAPGQDVEALSEVLSGLLRDAAPDGAEVAVTVHATSPPALFEPETPVMGLAAEALEEAFGKAPVFMRLGGTLPILAALSERGVPTVLTGVAMAEDAFHAPNESISLDRLALGLRAARSLYRKLATLPV